MNNFFKRPCEFIAGAATIESLPEMTHPEFAFVGRSNVGKSSLLNALVGQKHLVRTSQSPGHTKQLNFFLLAEKMMLVDMPGYGYAKVGKQQLRDWDQLIKRYLMGRANLKRTYVLIDARRGIMESDEDFMTVLDNAAVNYQLLLTKCDSVKEADINSILQSSVKIIKSHPAAHPDIIATSSEDGRGIETLQAYLMELIT
ncbi:MAG: ribosome biogenesis GTP-binding protein YihA/YsxC [Rickettsiales bacterium]|nr:ribosome biogenesis GTP-binding protein YihA/YsxC [Rickettsiales bacterium]